MERVRVDWHIHTTLSPCGSLAMDPQTIIDKACNSALQIIGITDHNSTRQARLFKTEYNLGNLTILMGAEVTTREEIHCLAFFEELGMLDYFQKYLDDHLPYVKNNPEIFGDQVVVSPDGCIVYEEEKLLLNALDQSIDEVGEFVLKHGGIFIPAHVNRPGNGLLSQLGMIPREFQADALEWVPDCRCGLDRLMIFNSSDFLIVNSSDAHYPDDIGHRWTELEIADRSFFSIRNGLQLMKRNPCGNERP